MVDYWGWELGCDGRDLGTSMHAQLISDTRWARNFINLGSLLGFRGKKKKVKGASRLHIADGHDQVRKLET